MFIVKIVATGMITRVMPTKVITMVIITATGMVIMGMFIETFSSCSS